MKHNQLGSTGEQLVVNELGKKGFTIHAQNYRKFVGEVDIIAQKGTLLIFVEVKARRNPLFDMAELISYTKQKKIIATAKYYCIEKNITNVTCRFDVALVSHENKGTTITIIENAFTESHYE
jgi:putative endonuclease